MRFWTFKQNKLSKNFLFSVRDNKSSSAIYLTKTFYFYYLSEDTFARRLFTRKLYPYYILIKGATFKRLYYYHYFFHLVSSSSGDAGKITDLRLCRLGRLPNVRGFSGLSRSYIIYQAPSLIYNYCQKWGEEHKFEPTLDFKDKCREDMKEKKKS